MDITNTLIADITKIAIKYLIAEFKQQGHELTGAFEREIQSKYEKTLFGTTIQILMPYYGRYLERGVPAARIPFSPNSGRPHSKYIEALIGYAKLRMNVSSEKEATSIAFAIAKKHKKEGMPTKASARFSTTGKRIEFIDDATPEIEKEINKYLLLNMQVAIETILYNAIKK